MTQILCSIHFLPALNLWDLKDERGDTALIKASELGLETIVDKLIKKGSRSSCSRKSITNIGPAAS